MQIIIIIINKTPTDSHLERGWGLGGVLLCDNGPPTRVCSEGGPYGCKKIPPTRVWSEGGVWGVCCCVTTAHQLAFAARVGRMDFMGRKRPHRLAFGARVGSVGESLRKMAHRLAFAARVGRMGRKRPHRLAFGARVGSWVVVVVDGT